jgi:hypothetical protein
MRGVLRFATDEILGTHRLQNLAELTTQGSLPLAETGYLVSGFGGISYGGCRCRFAAAVAGSQDEQGVGGPPGGWVPPAGGGLRGVGVRGG